MCGLQANRDRPSNTLNMPKFKENYCLKDRNTFGVDAKAKYFTAFNSIIELNNILDSEIYNTNKTFMIGGGSNILFTQDFEGLVLYIVWTMTI